MHQAGQISWSASRDGDRVRSCQSSTGHHLWHLIRGADISPNMRIERQKLGGSPSSLESCALAARDVRFTSNFVLSGSGYGYPGTMPCELPEVFRCDLGQTKFGVNPERRAIGGSQRG